MYLYGGMIANMKARGKFQIRLEMSIYASRFGIQPAARVFKTTNKTVRKWLQRFNAKGLSGLEEQSRRPKHSPNKCSQSFEQKIIALRIQTKNKYGARKLIERFGLEKGKKCIQRIINQHGLAVSRKKKYEKQNNLRSVKRLYKAFEKLQVDVKELRDIANYWPQMTRKGLPRYEITARDVKTGATFVCLAKRNDSINASAFLAYVLRHLSDCGFDVKGMEIQADNGAEFFACGKSKYNATPFEKVISKYGCRVSRIPPRSPTFNSDVETFHRLGEDEFWAIEQFEDKRDLRQQLYTYLLDFNYRRKNSYKENKTPWELFQEDYPSHSTQVLNLAPVVMDDHIDYLMELTADPVAEVTKRTGKIDPFKDPNQVKAFESYGYHVPGLHNQQK